MVEDKNIRFRELLKKNLDMSIEEKERTLIATFTDEALVDISKLTQKDFLKKCFKEVEIQTLKENRDFFVQLLNDAGIGVPEYLERGKEIGNFEDTIVTMLFLDNDKNMAFLGEYFPKIAPIINKALAKKYKNEALKKKDKFKTMKEEERNSVKIFLNRAMKLDPTDGDICGHFAKLEESGEVPNLTTVAKYYKMAYESTKKQEWKEAYNSISDKIKQLKDKLEQEGSEDKKDLQTLSKDEIISLYKSTTLQIDYLISLGQYDVARDKCDRALQVIKTLRDDSISYTASEKIDQKRNKIGIANASIRKLENDAIEDFANLGYGVKTDRIKEINEQRDFKLSQSKGRMKDIESINNCGMMLADLYEQIGKKDKALEIYVENIQRIEQMDDWIQYNDFKSELIIDNMCRKAKILNLLSQEDVKNRDEYKRQEIEEYTKILKMASLEDRIRTTITYKKINALMDIGDNENALKECDYALSLYEYRNELEMLSKKATIMLKMGNKEEALYTYMTMAAIDPSNKEIVEILSCEQKTLEAFKNFNDKDVDMIGQEKGTLKDIKMALAELRNNLPDNSLERAYINKTIHKFNVFIKEGRIKDARTCLLQIGDVIKGIPTDSEAISNSKRNILDYMEIEQYKDLLGRLSKEQIMNQTLQIVNNANNHLYGQVPVGALCANIFTALNKQIRESYKNDEDYQIHKQSHNATLECVIKDKKEVYYKNLVKLKPNDPKSFIVAPILADGHFFSTLIYKTTAGYNCIIVNKGDREEHLPFEKYSFSRDKLDAILDLVGVGDQKRFPIGKIYEIFRDNAYSVEKLTDIEARDQVVGNCFVKEMEEAIKFSNALIFDSYEIQKVPKFTSSDEMNILQVKVPKWQENTQDIHIKMLQLIKEVSEDEEIKKFMDETIKVYTNNKGFSNALRDNKDMSNYQKKELFINLFNPQDTIDINKLNNDNFLKECLKTVNLRALKENRDFFAMLLEENKIIVPEFMKRNMEFMDLDRSVAEIFVNGENSRKFLREYFPAVAKEIERKLIEYYEDEIDNIEFNVDYSGMEFLEINKGKIQYLTQLLDRDIELGCHNSFIYLYRAQLEDNNIWGKDLNLMCNCYKMAYEISREPSMEAGYNKVLEALKQENLHKEILVKYEETEEKYKSEINVGSDVEDINGLTQDKRLKLEQLFEYNIEVMRQAGRSGNDKMIEKSYIDAIKILVNIDDKQINEYDSKFEETRVNILFEYRTKMMKEAAKAGDIKELEKEYAKILNVLKEADEYEDIDEHEVNEYLDKLREIRLSTVCECKIECMAKAACAGDYEEVIVNHHDALYEIKYVTEHGDIEGDELEEWQDKLYLAKTAALEKLKDANSPLRKVDMSKGIDDYKKLLMDYENKINDFKIQDIDESYIINIMGVKADILNVLAQIDKENARAYKEIELEEYNKILGIMPKDDSDRYSILNNKIDVLVDLGKKEEALLECDYLLRENMGDAAEILDRQASILKSQELGSLNKIRNLKQQLRVYKGMNMLEPSDREIRHRLIDTHSKLIMAQNKLYLDKIIENEKEIFGILNINEQRVNSIQKLKDIFDDNKLELSIHEGKAQAEEIRSYYAKVSQTVFSKGGQTKQEIYILNNNYTIVKCMESICKSLGEIITYQQQKVSDDEYNKIINKICMNILNNIKKIDNCNKQLNTIYNQVVDKYFNDIENMQRIMGQQQELSKEYEFVIKGDDNVTRTINIMSKQISAAINMGMQREMLEGLEDLAKLKSNDLVVLNGKALILEKIGEKEGALKVYKNMMEIAPNVQEIRDKIEKLSSELEILSKDKQSDIKREESFVQASLQPNLSNQNKFIHNLKSIAKKQENKDELIQDVNFKVENKALAQSQHKQLIDTEKKTKIDKGRTM